MEKNNKNKERLAITTNTRNKWALVDQDGKIVEKFRLKQTALANTRRYTLMRLGKLKVVSLSNLDTDRKQNTNI